MDRILFTSLNIVLSAILTKFLDTIYDQTDLFYPSSERETLYEEVLHGRFQRIYDIISDWFFQQTNRSCNLILLFDDLHRGLGCEWLEQAMSVLRPLVSFGNMQVILSVSCR